jgi:hypothetical protein
MELPVTINKSPITCAIEVKCIGDQSEEANEPELLKILFWDQRKFR